jgi:hypothetical protein
MGVPFWVRRRCPTLETLSEFPRSGSLISCVAIRATGVIPPLSDFHFPSSVRVITSVPFIVGIIRDTVLRRVFVVLVIGVFHATPAKVWGRRSGEALTGLATGLRATARPWGVKEEEPPRFIVPHRTSGTADWCIASFAMPYSGIAASKGSCSSPCRARRL